MVLFYPSAALAITVLAFIMMGDAVKDALLTEEPYGLSVSEGIFDD